MADIYVFNASPLILLSRLGGLDWLVQIGEQRLVPARVVEELDAGSERDGTGALIRAHPAMTIIAPSDIDERVAAWGLDPGESHVLTLALARRAIAVLDDRAARRAAAALGVQLSGTLGVLAVLTRRHVITDFEGVISAARDAGLYLSDDLVADLIAELKGDDAPSERP